MVKKKTKKKTSKVKKKTVKKKTKKKATKKKVTRNPRKLTGKQDRFCREYIIDHNGTQAAIRAGYSKKGAEVTAFNSLRNTKVLKRIKELEKPAVEKAGVTAEKVIQKLADIAFLDPLDLFEEDGTLKDLSDMPKAARCVITGIEVTEETDATGKIKIGYTKKIKLSPAIKALELLGKTNILSLFSDNINLNNGNEKPVTEEVLNKANKQLAKDIAVELKKIRK